MGARVLFRDSQGRDGQVDLSPSMPVYVGRALDCAIRTDDAMVSRKHSMIRMDNGRFYVEDLGSSNGTHVNDVRVTKHPLTHNDVVRCGSLWLRYVEDGPLVTGPALMPERPKGGTQRLEAMDFGLGAGGYPGQNQGAMPDGGAPVRGGVGQGTGAGRSSAYGQPGPVPMGGGTGARGPASSSGAIGGYGGFTGQRGPAGPYAGQPLMNHSRGESPRQPPFDQGGPANAQGIGPASQGLQPGSGYDLFGGPPAMPVPAEGIVGGDFITPPRSAGPPIGDEDSIVVDLPDAESTRLRKELDEAVATVEKLQIAYDREVADSKRLRAEIVTHKDRTDELRRALAERDEVVEAHNRVADELREELRQTKDSLAGSRTQESELSDLVAARERQLARNQEDIGQLKREMQDKDRQLSDVSRTKDEGWRKLNEQLTEIDHLREVINQQERMLEERRVGLISQEEVIKELRGDKEQHLREMAQLKAEREELKSATGRLNAQVSAIDEENRRLTQLLTELRARGGGGGEADHAAAAHAAAVTAELKTLRIALKTVESDRDQLKQQGERAEGEVDKLRERLAQLEVELREAHDQRDRAQAGKAVADDATTRAELARHKAAEEAVSAARGRDETAALLAEVQRELDKARRRVTELEDDTQSQHVPAEAAIEENRRLERKLTEAGQATLALEAELRTARAELDAARRKSAAVKAADKPAGAAEKGTGDHTEVVAMGRNLGKIKDRAVEVHDGINDVLSELRNNAMILNEEFRKEGSERSPDSFRIMGEAIDALLAQAEEAKGVLRRLRELVEFGDE